MCGDLAGLRPLYYTLRGGEPMVWATRAPLLGFPLTPDLPLLAAQIATGTHHWPNRTPYAKVRRVPGGYGLLYAPGRPPHLVDLTDAEPAAGLREGAAGFGQALTDAVYHRVRAAGGKVGADLSGGLDSSTAVLLAAEAGQVHAVTYSDVYTSAEDLAFAARVAAHPRVRHTIAEGGPAELPFGFPASVPIGDEPVFALANWGMDAAYLAPVKNLALHLTGHGGDVVLDSSAAEDGRHQVAALLHQAARDTHQPEQADLFDQWAALHAMGSSASSGPCVSMVLAGGLWGWGSRVCGGSRRWARAPHASSAGAGAGRG